MALNFLVTGVKMLKKSLDKKKMKEGAKKFVGGDKEEKRAKVSKIMDEESSYGVEECSSSGEECSSSGEERLSQHLSQSHGMIPCSPVNHFGA